MATVAMTTRITASAFSSAPGSFRRSVVAGRHLDVAGEGLPEERLGVSVIAGLAAPP